MSVARPARSLLRKCVASARTAQTVGCQHQAQPHQLQLQQQQQQQQFQSQSQSHFHTSAPRPTKRRSRFRNVKAEDMGLLSKDGLDKYRQEKFPDYTPEELDALSKKYTPEQLEALKAGEAAIDPEDLIFQGRLRDDPYRPQYMEDYTVLDPRYDVKPEIEGTPWEPQWLNPSDWADKYGSKLADLTDKKTSDQLTRAMVRALRRVKESNGEELIDLTEEELVDLEKDPELLKKYLVEEDGDDKSNGEAVTITQEQAMKLDRAIDEEWRKELSKIGEGPDSGELEPTNLELIEDGPAGTSRLHSAEAPELGKVPGVEGLYKSAADPEDEGQDDDGRYQEIKRLTGMSLRDIQSIYRKVLVTRWVTNQTRLGKVRSTSIVAIAGNGNGRLGLGIAKSTEAGLAAETAQLLAIRNMKPIRRYENRTIYGNAKAKVSGTVVELFARPPGFGLRCPHRIFEMCRASGIHDIAARMPRSKNPMNSVKAAYEALMNQVDPEEIAIGRGKKMVDVRKVYYGGNVY
ncbi:37S ribosomal protein S5 [Trichoderma reesei RUT C-30]|uniref:37S ribosomal protein S5 n=1 Tax=Hypocrea jecorina (strain ATCC 56765 / BCRC 32924 / NRRL 11460 / Rut C-30) TaxID=1344414 RepID=A0A024S9M6_HYPJR|nr:37S ribosomal protein S5 [Trichoderma reesei RUT C-30]